MYIMYIIYIHMCMYFLRVCVYMYIYTCICTSTYCICRPTYYIRIFSHDSNYPSFSVLCQVTTDPLDAPWIVAGSRWDCGHPRPCRWHASMRFVERYEGNSTSIKFRIPLQYAFWWEKRGSTSCATWIELRADFQLRKIGRHVEAKTIENTRTFTLNRQDTEM